MGGRAATGRVEAIPARDAIVLPQVLDVTPGRWRLVIERQAPHDSPASLLLSFSVLERFDFSIATTRPQARAGQPILVFLRPLDYGDPIEGLGSITLRARNENGSTASSVEAIEHLKAPPASASPTNPAGTPRF